ncbi:4-hydroxyacetophenone monooxygenase [Nocardioides gansuensis]|uniref:4-hydroxyacetophenone monooxygenase n=1 Tax=Nocardioides gansuensis TaxID=2138300 RepID=A0A2T8F7X4_9ACTN|nr:NAD(P)/FAD-dependent oxidoreductase [Nocardioides gansuensis]PVG81767.1 4-hydroxyacetophenone monooxygenase [Nocardioides gansuensis]
MSLDTLDGREATVLPTHVTHLVVGAGFAGVGAAIKLDEIGERDYLVLERSQDVGGTWLDNSYPGAACDVPSPLYSYSFAPNPEWSMSFSPQPEIQAYLRKVAERAGILDRFRFGTTLEEARWDEDAQLWRILTSAGELTATTIMSGSGGLSAPKLPDIEGIEGFEGELFHSSRWDHSAELAGKRIAVIGTGASAIQIVPELQQIAGRLDVYQRTAPWVIPRHDRAYTGLEKFLFKRVPAIQRVYRTAIYWGRELYVPAFTWQPRLAAPARKMALANIDKGISDPELRAKVTPDYQIGCKRILISSTYYPALEADNTELVTDRIARVTPTGIVTADDTEREVDVIVVATGFHTTEQPIAEHIFGRGGRSLATVWGEAGMASYKGTTTRGFPNFFQIVGANTGLGHSSMVFIIESQLAYVTSALRRLRAEGFPAVEPRRQVQDEWNADIQRRMKRTVWSAGGCASWYLDAHGRNTTLWPRTTFTFRRLLSDFDADAYEVEARTAPLPGLDSARPAGLDSARPAEEVSA